MVIACSYCFLSVSFRSLKSQTGSEEQSGKEGMTAPDMQSHSLTAHTETVLLLTLTRTLHASCMAPCFSETISFTNVYHTTLMHSDFCWRKCTLLLYTLYIIKSVIIYLYLHAFFHKISLLRYLKAHFGPLEVLLGWSYKQHDAHFLLLDSCISIKWQQLQYDICAFRSKKKRKTASWIRNVHNARFKIFKNICWF